MVRVFLILALLVGLLMAFPLPGISSPISQGDDMALIPEGYFIMGTGPETGKAGEDYGVDEEPRHKIYIREFYIDRYEVTIGQYKKYLKATGLTWVGDTDFPDEYPPEVVFNPPQRDKYPVNYMSWNDANEFCHWKVKRLPTEEEWEKAARGTDGTTYPWGNEFDPQKTNSEDAGIKGPAPVGSFPEDKSPFGLYDVSGNLMEWTSSHYLPYEGNTLKDGRWTTNAYVLKGGSFLLPGKLFARPARRSIAYPGYAHRMFGFRCVKDVH
ncbi:MAG: SUMF1/EgtB/PvdO family nonheme iron enzyme [Nitrospirae bacterium]|nr:SUMF1/EgtB/PvdO family nonheme iron enzyme [Nitrospirota bacterium]